MHAMGFDCGYDSLAFELALEPLKAECVIQEGRRRSRRL